MVDQTSFYVYKLNQGWQKLFIKGVNIGAGKPGFFPGELAITKEEYLRWFYYIGQMHANTIRVYTALKPAFYDALYEYNLNRENPLYVMHGVWINEDDITTLQDAYASQEKIKTNFIKDTQDIIDIIHGNAVLPARPGYASGTYTHDVSPYVNAWILGIEWDPGLVMGTNANNPAKTSFQGKYIYTEGASPFEVFLSEVAEATIAYENDKYNVQRPLSFANWVTTDPLKHSNEPLATKEDAVEVNVEHIKRFPAFLPGLFASYHIYPYYPEFMNYQHEYITFKDDDGKINTYKAYLRDLRKVHTMPVLVAEFGIPAGRGMAHRNIHMGWNQGNVEEKVQGTILAKMLDNIYQEGYAGGLVFAWQDEWFKRTWNTMDFDVADTRAYWSNPQTNEQQFGILTFDPGKNDICNVDGEVKEWRKDVPVYTDPKVKLYVKSDERFVYLMADVPDFDFNKDTLLIPLDTIPNQGNFSSTDYSATFSRAADFLIVLNKTDNSKILVDPYYDSFYYLYAKQTKFIDRIPAWELKENSLFVPMYLCLNKPLFLPDDNITLPFSKYETGHLLFGDGNPYHVRYRSLRDHFNGSPKLEKQMLWRFLHADGRARKDSFNSLADYYYRTGKFEIRIPWQLLNVMNPQKKQIMSDMNVNNAIKPEATEGFYFGAGVLKPNTAPATINMNFYSWSTWDLPTYHERLKQSYYILKKSFAKYR